MKTLIEFELEAFLVPDFVTTKRSPISGMESMTLSLKSLDSKTLEDLCSQFRAAVFRKAA